MTVETTDRKQIFAGGQGTLTFTFKALVDHPEDIKVTVTLTSTGAETALTYGDDYTVSLGTDGVGGTVTVSPTYSTLYTQTVYRETTNTQTSDYDDYNQFPADTLENDLDRRTMVEQEISEALTRAVKLPISSSADATMPTPSANKLLGWNAAGTAIVNKSSTGEAVTFDELGTGVINAYDYGFLTTNTGAQNKIALDAAVAAGAAGQSYVFLPAGNYNLTGTIATSCPIIGAGHNHTYIYPTTSVPAFDVSMNYGRFGGMAIWYTNVGYAGIDANAIGIRLLHSAFAKFYDISVARGYRAIQLLSTVGDGYIWQTEFDNVVSANNKDYAFYFQSATDSTTLKFSNCHVFAQENFDTFWPAAQTFKGWYTENCTSIIMSNCSMDGGDGDVDGSVIFVGSGQSLIIDSFHLEVFEHTTGGTSCSPIVAGMYNNKIENLLLASCDTDVGAGNTGYWIRAEDNLTIGSINELGCLNNSGTRKYAYFKSYGFVTQKDLAASSFSSSGAIKNIIFANDIFNDVSQKQVLGNDGISVGTSSTTLLNVPVRTSDGRTGNDSGIYWVQGQNGSTGVGFLDLIALVSSPAGTTTVNVISSQENTTSPARAYSWDNTGKNIKCSLTSGSSTVRAGGFSLISIA